MVILTAVDIAGFSPTFRKSYDHPFDEQFTFFVLRTARNTVAAVALKHFSAATLMVQTVMTAVCVVCIATVLHGRRAVE